MGHFGGWPRAWFRQTRERDEPHDVKTAHGYSRAREAMAFVAFHLSDVMIGGRSGIDRFVRISAGAAANLASPGECFTLRQVRAIPMYWIREPADGWHRGVTRWI
jgi:hypothetical protein